MKFLSIYLVLITVFMACGAQSHEDIIIVNTGPYDKARIAREIEILSDLNPTVISLDVAFPQYKGDEGDILLRRALSNVKRLVLPSTISYEGKDYFDREMISVTLACAVEFLPVQAISGFVSAQKSDIDRRIPEQFIVWQESYAKDIYYHFSVVTASEFDSLGTLNFIHNHDRLINVNFGNGKRKFRTFSASDVFRGKLSKKDIEGKIVMMGFLGPGTEDKFISPLNENQREPDMYGVEYLAHIVAQILEYNH